MFLGPVVLRGFRALGRGFLGLQKAVFQKFKTGSLEGFYKGSSSSKQGPFKGSIRGWRFQDFLRDF